LEPGSTEEETNEFLYGGQAVAWPRETKPKQTVLKPMKGVEWLAWELVVELADCAVQDREDWSLQAMETVMSMYHSMTEEAVDRVEDRKAEELIANCSLWTDEAQQWEDWEPLMYAKQTVSAGRRRRKRKQKEALRDRLYGWLVKKDRQDLVEDMDWQESGAWNVRQLEEQQKRENRRWRARILQLRWKERKKVALATEAWCREEVVSWLWRVLDQQTRDNLWDRQAKAARREVEWWEEEERRKCDVEMTEVEEEQYGMETDDAPDACIDCVEPGMMMDHCVELKDGYSSAGGGV
jgi:hypothetical protein